MIVICNKLKIKKVENKIIDYFAKWETKIISNTFYDKIIFTKKSKCFAKKINGIGIKRLPIEISLIACFYVDGMVLIVREYKLDDDYFVSRNKLSRIDEKYINLEDIKKILEREGK